MVGEKDYPPQLKEAIAVKDAFGSIPLRDVSRSFNQYLIEVNRANWSEAHGRLVEVENLSRILYTASESDFSSVEAKFDMLRTFTLLVGDDEFKRMNCNEIAQELVGKLSEQGIVTIMPLV